MGEGCHSTFHFTLLSVFVTVRKLAVTASSALRLKRIAAESATETAAPVRS